jgi:hypothetical protein
MTRRDVVEIYRTQVDEITNQSNGRYNPIYLEMYNTDPWTIDNYTETLPLLYGAKKILEALFEERLSNDVKEVGEALNGERTQNSIEVVNGNAELVNQKGEYLGRISTDVVAADVCGYDVVTVNKAGDVLLNESIFVTDNAISVKFVDKTVIIGKRNGDVVTYDIEGSSIMKAS